MALYVQLSREDLAAVTAAFALGKLEGAEGIPQGSINTNYRLETASGRYFLRHTTVRSAGDLEFEAGLLGHLAEGAFPAPRLVRSKDGAAFVEVARGRVSVFRWLAGEELTRDALTPDHLERLGAAVGKLHRV